METAISGGRLLPICKPAGASQPPPLRTWLRLFFSYYYHVFIVENSQIIANVKADQTAKVAVFCPEMRLFNSGM